MARSQSAPRRAASAVTEPPTARPMYTLTKAQEMTGASRSTLRRRLAAGSFPNAVNTGKTGAWEIPVSDLLAAGLRVGAPAAGWDLLSERGPGTTVSSPPGLAERVAELEQALAVEQTRRAAAEQLAEERAGRVSDLQTALRMLEPGPVGRAEMTQQTQQPAARRRLFRRAER